MKNVEHAKDNEALNLVSQVIEQTNATAPQHRALAAAIAHLKNRVANLQTLETPAKDTPSA